MPLSLPLANPLNTDTTQTKAEDVHDLKRSSIYTPHGNTHLELADYLARPHERKALDEKGSRDWGRCVAILFSALKQPLYIVARPVCLPSFSSSFKGIHYQHFVIVPLLSDISVLKYIGRCGQAYTSSLTRGHLFSACCVRESQTSDTVSVNTESSSQYESPSYG